MPPQPPLARQAMYSNISPPDSNGTDDGVMDNNSNGGRGGKMTTTTVKPQKACVQCRRSKVKCVHEGGPPCRRCNDTNQECKFRLRADDETWREKTDETLSKLTSAIDTLISRGVPATVQPSQAHSVSGSTPSYSANTPSYHHPRPAMPMRNSSAPGLYAGYAHHSPGPHQYQAFPSNPSSSSFNAHMHAGPSSGRTMSNGGLHSLLSPHSDSMSELHSPAFDANPNGSTIGNSSSPDRRILPRKREAPTPEASDFQAPSPQTPSQHNRPRLNSASLMPPPLPPPTHSIYDQISPSPVLSHLLSNASPLYVHGVGIGPRWMMGQTTSYAKATLTIGRDDPRMTSISLGTVSMEKARTLMLFFAEKMQPHSFGFPTYPAAEQMTPVIISAILMVSSLYEPWSRNSYSALKSECLAHIKPDQDVHADMPLDPELGIGVEEITGACIASAWIGGELGWRIARVSRWWTIGYLKHFELPDRDVTLGECLTILPPFRQIDLVDKLRIFLAAYVAEAQQAFVLDRPSLVPNSDPMPYVDALRNAFNNNNNNQQSSLPSMGMNGSSMDTRGSMTGGSQGAKKHPPPPDRQLTGHASILSILLEAQRSQREARWYVNEEFGRQHGLQHGDRNIGGVDPAMVNECVDRLISLWMMWMDDTERWRSEVAALEDLSSSTASALDLTMIYHLAKAHLGSLALEPEFRASAAVARAAVNEARFIHMQSHVVNMAKAHALSALRLAISSDGFRDRLLYLPGFYHFLLAHAAGYLLLLLQRKNRFMLAGEAKSVLETVETFVQIFVTELATHNFHPHSAHSVHPSMATAESLARACQHVRGQVRGA